MAEHKVFNDIPLTFPYDWLKVDFYKHADAIISNEKGRTPVNGVNGALALFYDDMIDENGMDRVAVIVIGFVYEMEHDHIDPDLAYAVNWHIKDFENGDYESLFNQEDLTLLKDDMAKVNNYLNEHPEMLKK